MNRREFVALAGGAVWAWPLTAGGQSSPPLSPVRQDWLDRHTETILEPELPIVNPHHHLWVRPGWRYLADDLLADTEQRTQHHCDGLCAGPFDVSAHRPGRNAPHRRDRVRQRCCGHVRQWSP